MSYIPFLFSFVVSFFQIILFSRGIDFLPRLFFSLIAAFRPVKLSLLTTNILSECSNLLLGECFFLDQNYETGNDGKAFDKYLMGISGSKH